MLVFQGGPGVVGSNTPLGLSRWSDGDIAGGNFTGFNSPPAQFTAVTSPIIDLVFAVPQNRIRGLREWNQGGGDLNDQDGFASWDATFYDSALAVITTGNMVMGNGGAPFTFLLPGGQIVNDVAKARLSNMRKLNPGATVAPLVREVQALQINPVYSCRTPAGVLQWYDPAGNLIPTGDLVDCP